MERFRGHKSHHGIYVLPKGLLADEKGKMESPDSDRKTHKGEPDERLWDRHLAGEGGWGLGVVPIDENDQCRWAAIDLDVYKTAKLLEEMEGRVNALGLPLIVTRTKSGGVHLFLFLSEPVDASVVRAKLTEWLGLLGLGGKTEVFPKQDTLPGNSHGSWLNMPYQNNDHGTTRYGLRSAEPLTAEAFLDYADEKAINKATLIGIVNEVREARITKETGEQAADDWYQAPPCLIHICKVLGGQDKGGRDNALYNIAIYLRKRYKDEWQEHLWDYNQKYMKPPLDLARVEKITKMKKSDYSYKCKDIPIAEFCNKTACNVTKFGVWAKGSKGVTNEDPTVEFGRMRKYEGTPPSFKWEIDNKWITFQLDHLMDQRQFQKIVYGQLSKVPASIKADVWIEIIERAAREAEIIPQPEEQTDTGYYYNHLRAFVTTHVGQTEDTIRIGLAYTNGNGRTYFDGSAFVAYLKKMRADQVNRQMLIHHLQDKDIKIHKLTIKGVETNAWSIPKPPEEIDQEIPTDPNAEPPM